MKELNDSERLEVAMSLLDDEQVDAYAEQCRELEQDYDDGYGTVGGGRAPLD